MSGREYWPVLYNSTPRLWQIHNQLGPTWGVQWREIGVGQGRLVCLWRSLTKEWLAQLAFRCPHTGIPLCTLVCLCLKEVSLGLLIKSPWCRCLCVICVCHCLNVKNTLQESQQNFVTIWCSMKCAFWICFSCIIINDKGKYTSSVFYSDC